MSIKNLKAAADYAGSMYKQNPDLTINIQARFKGILVRGFNNSGGREGKVEKLVSWQDAEDASANLILLAVQDVEHDLLQGRAR